MSGRVTLAIACVALLLSGGSDQTPRASGLDSSVASGDPSLARLLDNPFADCVDYASAQATMSIRPFEGGVLDEEWPPDAIGGMIPPVRQVHDPFPTFDGMALDVENGKVIFSDENRHSLMVYDRTAGSFADTVTEPEQHIYGPRANLGFIAGVEVDPTRKEFYTVNNDGGDQMVVFTYGDHGNVKPRRSLLTAHQSWDVALAPKRDEIAVTVQQSNAISIYKRGATGHAAPIRTIRGLASQLEDPHGVFFDEQHGEIITANHGNWTQIRPYTPYDPAPDANIEYKSGAFHKPSITFHSVDANGDVAPVRIIEGDLTGLNWPMGIDVDLKNDEIAVANYGDSSIRVFSRGKSGDVQPARVIRGANTGIVGPIGVAIDAKHDEIWVANYGDHTAVVFPRTAQGNVKPKRIIRNAPKGAPTTGFTNASATAYDPKRDKILVPN